MVKNCNFDRTVKFPIRSQIHPLGVDVFLDKILAGSFTPLQ